IQLLETGAELDRQGGRNGARAHKLIGLAYLEGARGKPDRLLLLCREALREDSSTHVLMRAGALYARHGLIPEAHSLLRRAEGAEEGTKTAELAVQRLKAEVLLAGGQYREATAASRAASDLGQAAAARGYPGRTFGLAGRRR